MKVIRIVTEGGFSAKNVEFQKEELDGINAGIGPKTLTPVLFFALSFAEKFFGADISHIVYGKIVFNKDKTADENTAELYDVTPLYYLNSLTSVMSAPDGKTALEFFAL